MFLWFCFISLVPSVVVHEVSHGYVAYLCGDPTAKQQHRLTLNPLRHIDLFGTIILPAMLLFVGLPAFGYAKPVPVNVGRLRHPRQQALWVALVGPGVNLAFVVIGYGICELAIHVANSYDLLVFGAAFGLVNLVLAAFNLLPIPPLDGSAIIERFIPRRHLPKYYEFRNRFLPFFFILLILDYAVFHVGTNWLNDLETWWLNRVSSI